MERREDVYHSLGKSSVDHLLNEIRKGHLKESDVKRLAIAMNHSVHGVYEEKRKIERESLDVTMLYMLDRWWQDYLYQPSVNGVEELIDILQDIELKHLAHKIKETSQQALCGNKEREGEILDILPRNAATGSSSEGGTSSSSTENKQSKAQKKEDLYILVLGETGVGKSTWVNGIANYMKHETLENAVNGEFSVLIPSKFVHIDDDGTRREIKMGDQSNDEILQEGLSATQAPKEYTFETGLSTVHFIDTPGIGDVRGIHKDKENFDNILEFLLKFEKINGVCVLLKPNTSRLTISFRFCVLELLTHLHKSLEQNILFCFTNSRSTFYKPGDTMPVLEKLLAKHNIGIKLDKTRYFCIDNEPFRFLACLKHSVEFDFKARQAFSESWEHSLKTTEELIERVKSLPPHDTEKTLRLNATRSVILALSKPMAETLKVIDNNKKKVKSVQKEIDLVEEDIHELEKSLKFKGFDIELEALDHPITVCAHNECKRLVPVGLTQVTNTVYDVICHDHCTIKGIPTETVNDERLAYCYAFDFETAEAKSKFFGKDYKELKGYKETHCYSQNCGDHVLGHSHWNFDKELVLNSLNPEKRDQYEDYEKARFRKSCWNCGHDFKLHIHMTYKTVVVEREFLSDAAQANINSKKGFKSKKDALKNELTAKNAALEEEKEFIRGCAPRFGSFLKQNALIPYNDAFKEYIDMLIYDEEHKPEDEKSFKQIRKLQKEKKIYEENKVLLEESLNASAEKDIQNDDIFLLRDKLVNLKHNGKLLKDALEFLGGTQRETKEGSDEGERKQEERESV